MQFTDSIFAIFLIVIFILYWFPLRGKTVCQNALLLGGSYVFYGWWDARFLALIFLTSLTTFLTALGARGKRGKLLTTVNIIFNLGILISFKYLGFFTENLGKLLSLFNLSLDWFTLEVLVPVGISFYTFQAIAYSVDVYKGRIEACRNPLDFFTFISYFPQLVAGPIERASQLLPQITGCRKWDPAMASTGMRMIMFGLLKKLCVADMLAMYVDRIFTGGELSAMMALAGGVLFSFEIYCDFSAYSEIARGVSRLLGIELMVNFRFPFFSRNIPEFWRRWHISLMEWFRDYLYIPLGGNRKGNARTSINIMIVFVLSGFWHGSAWNFVIWGVYWGIFSIIARFILKQKSTERPIVWNDLPDMLAVFGVVAFGFYLFRCSTTAEILSGLKWSWLYFTVFALARSMMRAAVRYRVIKAVYMYVGGGILLMAGIYLICQKGFFLLKLWWLLPALIVFATEWKSRQCDWPMQITSKKQWQRLVLYAACVFFIIISEPTEMAFIYFQF